MILRVARKIVTDLRRAKDSTARGLVLACTLESHLPASQFLLGGKDLSEEIFDFLLVRLKPVPSVV